MLSYSVLIRRYYRRNRLPFCHSKKLRSLYSDDVFSILASDSFAIPSDGCASIHLLLTSLLCTTNRHVRSIYELTSSHIQWQICSRGGELYKSSRLQQWPRKAESSTGARTSESRDFVKHLRDRYSRELTVIISH